MSAAGLRPMVRVQWTIRRRSIAAWVLGLTGTLGATAVAIAGLYDTPAEIRSYADALAGGSLYAINGKVEGIDSLGGIIQDEFAFIAAFLLPLLGISLIAGSTRREEEEGRLELLLSGQVGRRSPLIAALLIAVGVIWTLIVAFSAVLALSGVPLAASILYAVSLGGLVFVFVGVSAVIAQITLHSRWVYFGSFAVLLVSYVLRGIGDVNGSWLTWLSPLGWQEKTAPTGDQRWWVLAIPIVVGAALAAIAVHQAGRRDLGSALIRAGTGAPRATRRLRSPLGFAFWLHSQSMIGWLIGSVVLGLMMGSLSQQVIDAMESNPTIAEVMGADGGPIVDGFTAVIQLYLAIIAIAYLVQAIGILRHEERAQRLEVRLAGTLSRTSWLTAHTAVILVGLIVIVAVSSVVFGIASAVSTGESGQVMELLRAGLAYLPAELMFAGLALFLFGMAPRFFILSWGFFAPATFIALLGPGLKLSHWLLDLSPTTHVGNPPLGTVSTLALIVMAAIACALLAAGFTGFRARDIPEN